MVRRFTTLFALTAAFGCGAAPAQNPAGAAEPAAEAPAAAVAIETATRRGFGAAFQRPSVDDAFTRAIDDLTSDPAVASAGEALLEKIGEHPRFQPVAASFLASLSESPEFERFIEEFMRDHPGLTPSEVGDAMGAHMAGVLERPALDKALDTALDQLFERPEMDAAVEELADAIVDDGVSDEMASVFAEELASPQVLPRLTARVKTPPDDPDFERALTEYLTSTARTDRFLIGFAKLFGDHPAPRRAVVEALGNDALVDASARELGELVAEPEFQRRAELALIAAVTNADEATLTARVEELVLLPTVERRFAGWMRKTAHLPVVTKAFAEAFREVARDPAFRALIEEAYLTDPQVAVASTR